MCNNSVIQYHVEQAYPPTITYPQNNYHASTAGHRAHLALFACWSPRSSRIFLWLDTAYCLLERALECFLAERTNGLLGGCICFFVILRVAIGGRVASYLYMHMLFFSVGLKFV